MWRSGEGWARFGLVKIKWEKDILIGIGLAVIVAVTDYLVSAVWKGTHLSVWSRLFPVPVPPDRLLLCLASSCSIGFYEELTCRAYLIPRLEKLTGATWKSVVLSALIFGVLHLHKGFGGVVHSVLTGTILGIGFCTTRRIWPVAIAHALNDFVVSTHLVAILGP
jgi:membrane protease YdiL (CAAX protease family)